ncbi:MAG: hypothetical protein ACLKAK_04730 [Alkaliphilus sp.]
MLIILIEKNERIFMPGKEELYRRLTGKECARTDILTAEDHQEN